MNKCGEIVCDAIACDCEEDEITITARTLAQATQEAAILGMTAERQRITKIIQEMMCKKPRCKECNKLGWAVYEIEATAHSKLRAL